MVITIQRQDNIFLFSKYDYKWLAVCVLEVFICTAVQIILWLFAQVHCRAAFTLSSRLPLFVYTLQLTVLYVAGGDAMLTGEDEGETNTNSLVVQ